MIILEENEAAIAWILAIILLSWLGLLLYALLGMNRKRRRLVRQLPETFFASHFPQDPRTVRKLTSPSQELTSEMVKTIELLMKSGHAPLTTDNDCSLFFSGSAHFRSLLRDLREAKHSINMTHYVWESDGLGEAIKEILLKKAGEGVHVKLNFDGWGSSKRITKRYKRELRQAGIQFCYFLGLKEGLLTKLKINYRNHRKITTIDGNIGYVGGMNVGMDYITGGKHFHAWRDTHMRLTGSVVTVLEALFLVDWGNSAQIPHHAATPPSLPDADFNSAQIPMQVVVSGPDSPWHTIELLYLSMINNAKKRIEIQTPYFVPSDAIMRALVTAAMGGTTVSLMITGISNHPITHWTGASFYRPLLEAGVRIFHYRAGLFHPKVIVVDEQMASVGTCNVDIRSLRLNYEVNIVAYGVTMVGKLRKKFTEDLTLCEEVTLASLLTKSLFTRFRDGFFRLLAPLI